MKTKIEYQPIGLIRTPFKKREGMPILDIKPYVPEFDHYPADRICWLEMDREGVRKNDPTTGFNRSLILDQFSDRYNTQKKSRTD